jgi:hypothetical protein
MQERLEKLELEKSELVRDYKFLMEEEHSRYGRLTNADAGAQSAWPLLGDKY